MLHFVVCVALLFYCRMGNRIQQQGVFTGNWFAQKQQSAAAGVGV